MLKKYFVHIIEYLFALNIIALGITFFIKSNIGMGAWDVLHYNLYEFYGLSVGTWVSIVGTITIFISLVIKFDWRNLFAIVTSLILGVFIDLWLIQILSGFIITSVIVSYIIFFIGLIFIGSGISLLVLSTLPPSSPDVLMLSLMKRFKLNFNAAKSITELSVLMIGILIGALHKQPLNNIGIGSLFTLIFIGSIVQKSSKFWKLLLSRIDKVQ